MPVARLLKLVVQKHELIVLARWKGLSTFEDTLEPIHREYKDVSKMVLRLLRQKNTPPDLAARDHEELGILERGL